MKTIVVLMDSIPCGNTLQTFYENPLLPTISHLSILLLFVLRVYRSFYPDNADLQVFKVLSLMLLLSLSVLLLFIILHLSVLLCIHSFCIPTHFYCLYQNANDLEYPTTHSSLGKRYGKTRSISKSSYESK